MTKRLNQELNAGQALSGIGRSGCLSGRGECMQIPRKVKQRKQITSV